MFLSMSRRRASNSVLFAYEARALTKLSYPGLKVSWRQSSLLAQPPDTGASRLRAIRKGCFQHGANHVSRVFHPDQETRAYGQNRTDPSDLPSPRSHQLSYVGTMRWFFLSSRAKALGCQVTDANSLALAFWRCCSRRLALIRASRSFSICRWRARALRSLFRRTAASSTAPWCSRARRVSFLMRERPLLCRSSPLSCACSLRRAYLRISVFPLLPTRA